MTTAPAPVLDRQRDQPGTPNLTRERLAGLGGPLVLVAGPVGIGSALLPAERGRLRVVVELLGLPVTTGAAPGRSRSRRWPPERSS